VLLRSSCDNNTQQRQQHPTSRSSQSNPILEFLSILVRCVSIGHHDACEPGRKKHAITTTRRPRFGVFTTATTQSYTSFRNARSTSIYVEERDMTKKRMSQEGTKQKRSTSGTRHASKQPWAESEHSQVLSPTRLRLMRI
jgi:hypothetical protein